MLARIVDAETAAVDYVLGGEGWRRCSPSHEAFAAMLCAQRPTTAA